MVSPADSSVCAHNVKTILHVASQVAYPLPPTTLKDPPHAWVFLGILISTNCMETSLPDDKLHKSISELQSWSTHNKCLKRELLSLIGKLNFACRIIPAGHIFLRLSISPLRHTFHITMNREARHNIAWWLRYLPSREGRAIMPDPCWIKSADLELFTDASGSLGYGIFYMGHWLAHPWPPELRVRSIQWQKLYLIALACLLWGHVVKKEAPLSLRQPSSSGCLGFWHFLGLPYYASCSFRLLSAATNHYTVLVTHIVGTNNSIADSVSSADISVLSPRPNSRLRTNSGFRISSDPLTHRLAFL